MFDRLHQADVALLNEVEELEAAVGVLFGDGDDEAEIGLDQLSLGLLGVHVALDHLALRALEFGDENARLSFDFFEIGLAVFLLAAVFLFELVAAAGLVLLFEGADLALEGAHGVDGLVDLVEQALALESRVFEFADDARDEHLFAGREPAVVAVFADLGLGGGCGACELLFELRDSFLVLEQRVDAGHGCLDARLNHLFGEFFVVEDDDLFDVAHAALEIFAERHDLANHDGRARDGLHHAHLAALDALGDFDLALARQQRHRAHLAQVHAHRVVGLFQGARRQVELDILALFQLEVLVAELRAIEEVDALGADGGDQVVQIVGRGCHLVRQHFVDVAVGEITLFLADLDQCVNIVIVIVVMVVLVFMCKLFVDRQNTPFLLRKCDAAPSCARCGTGCKAHKVKIFRHNSGKQAHLHADLRSPA